MTRHTLGLTMALVVAGCSINPADPMEGLHLDLIRMPPGFRIDVFADGLTGARSLARGPKGTVIVGTRSIGKVYALVDADGDQRAERVHVIAEGLRQPNGVAFKDGDLYVAEVTRILRFRGVEDHLDAPPAPEVVTDGFPDEDRHGWKFIAFGPDGHLYVPVGAPGNNVLREDEPIFSSITRLDVTRPQPGAEVFAHGVRNTVGFDWHPETGVLWFTENGRDWLADDGPPDELNRAATPGQHFGYPYWHGAGVQDPEYGDRRPRDAFVEPARLLGPHVAALGMRFYTGEQFPPAYRGAIFIAEHGSWNRAEPIGYRVTLVRLEGDRAVSYEPFAEGWLQGEEAWGRPVDVLVMPDGALLVSDDRAGVVYRISYQG